MGSAAVEFSLPCVRSELLVRRECVCSLGICQLRGAFSGQMGELDGFWRCLWFGFILKS